MSTGPSPIAGRGVFADEPYDTGAAVLTPAGDVPGPLNHSCDPSLGWTSPGTLVALREITAGDELTVDYSTVIADADLVLYCHCDTYRCRQVVEGTDWRIPQLQRRYAGHWAPAVQALIDSQ